MPHTIKTIVFQTSKLILLGLSLLSCRGLAQDSITPTYLASTDSATAPNVSLAPTQAKQIIIFINAGGSDDLISKQIEQVASQFAAQNNLDYESRSALLPEEINDQVRIVIALSPAPGIEELAASAPNTTFLLIGMDGIQPTDNLFTINNPAGTPEYLGFLAGYTAAVITEDWRVGILSISDTTRGKLTREAFLQGVRYFCGLCLQAYPPYYDYPIYVELPANSSQNDWRTAADQLRSNSVQTIFLAPEVGDEALLHYLSETGIAIISSTPFSDAAQENLAARFGTDLTTTLISVLAKMLSGEPGQSFEIAPEFMYTNPLLLSPGKIVDIEIIRHDLLDGYIYPLLP